MVRYLRLKGCYHGCLDIHKAKTSGGISFVETRSVMVTLTTESKGAAIRSSVSWRLTAVNMGPLLAPPTWIFHCPEEEMDKN